MFGAPWLLLWAISNHDEWARVKYGKGDNGGMERPSTKVALQKAARDRSSARYETFKTSPRSTRQHIPGSDRRRLAQGRGRFEMREQKRSMRPHDKGLAALYALLISIITMRAIRIRFSEWLEQRKSK
jgi:hypothetical protein